MTDLIEYIPVEEAKARLVERQGLRADVEAWWDRCGWGPAPLPPARVAMAMLAR
jgi:hypothetical protein